MAKPRKKTAAPEPPPMPRLGDKVTIPHAVSVLEVTHVSRDGDEVNLQRPGTNLEWFRVRTNTLTFVERKPPPLSQTPSLCSILERIAAVQEENLKRLDDDVGILKAYLKTQHAPKASIEALEGLTVKQHMSWRKAVDRIKKLLG
jgi:hypothetical protein